MLFLKICCLWLLFPALPDVPQTGQGPVEPQIVAQYYGAKQLGPPNTWTLKSGVSVSGTAFETSDVGLLRISKSADAAPQEVYVPLEEFTEGDQAQLKRFMSRIGSAVRYQHLPVIAYEIKRWNGPAPKNPGLVSRVVAVEDGQIFCITNRQLASVPESAVDPAEVAELKQKYKELGSGRYLEVKKFAREPFGGRLLAESDDDFVLETWEPHQHFGFRYPKGTRYRMPKYLMSDLLIRQLQAVLKRFAKEQADKQLSPAEIAALPCARQTRSGLKLCYPAAKAGEPKVETLSDQGQRRALQTIDLSCTDRVDFEYEALVSSGEMPGQDSRNAALVAVADSLSKQQVWQLKHAAPAYLGTPLGAIDDGFAFATIGGKQPFFVKASQLEEADRKLLQIAFKEDSYKWLTDIEPAQLFQTRLVVSHQRAGLFKAESKVQLDGAIKAEVASPNTDKPLNRSLYTGVHVDSLCEAGDAAAYMEKYAALITSNNRALAIQKIVAMRKYSADALPDSSKYVPIVKRETWHVGNKESLQFHGTLEGRWHEDFVFSDEFSGKKKRFLVAVGDLSDESRERAEELAARMTPQEWEKIVARAENWQYYRIWYVPERQSMLSSSACVILEFRSFGPAVQDIDGHTHTLLWDQVGGEEGGKAFLGRALKEGLANRAKAEQEIPKWTFKDCSQTLVAYFVGDYGDDVLLRDVNGIEFLMFKMSFDEPSLKEIDRMAKETRNQPQLTQEQRYKMPRMWCSYAELRGPAQLVDYVEMSRSWMIVKDTNNGLPRWAVTSLTRRERLATKALWLRQSQHLTDDRSLDRLLSQPVASSEIIGQTPNLLPALKQRIDKAWESGLPEFTWQSTPIKMNAQASLIAVDRDATCAIIIDQNKRWQVVDFASGKLQSLQELLPQGPTLGPWLYRGPEQVWWIDGGKLKKREAGGKVLAVIPDSDLTITLAGQSGDFESLVLHFSDDSMAKLELGTGRVQQLRPAPARRMPQTEPQLAASLDGSAVVIASQNTVVSSVFSRRREETEGLNFAGVAPPLHSVAVSRKLVVGTRLDSPELFVMNSAVQGLGVDRWFLPFVPKLFGFVNLGPETSEEFQVIGKLTDKFSQKSDRAFVLPIALEGHGHKPQIIVGDFDQNAVMAGNGAAVVHKRDGRYVVSRRPDLPRDFTSELKDLAEELLLKLDAGQLEATARYLEQPQFLTHCRYPGATADSFYVVVWVACLNLQPHVGGDRMERARLVIEKLLEKFPRSHLARNLLVSWHRDCAWEARGGGYADTVSEKGWEIFHAEFEKAKTELKPLLGQSDTLAATYASAIDIATATGTSLDSMRKLALEILGGPHAANVDLHDSIMQYLLPRWHGEPGMSEAYALTVAKQLGRSGGDAAYAKLICEISRFEGPNGPVTADMDLDLDRLFQGTKEYYEKWNDRDVMDVTLLLLHLAQRTEQIEELLRLRAEKCFLSGSSARAGWKTFRAIEKSIESQ